MQYQIICHLKKNGMSSGRLVNGISAVYQMDHPRSLKYDQY